MSPVPPPLPSTEKWQPVRSSRVLDGLELLSDGSVKIGEQVIPANVGLRNVVFDSLEISKSSGPDDMKLAVANKEGEYRFWFKNSKWYEPSAVRQKPAQADSTPKVAVLKRQYPDMRYLVKRYWRWAAIGLAVLVVLAVTMRVRRMVNGKENGELAGTGLGGGNSSISAARARELDQAQRELEQLNAELEKGKIELAAQREKLSKEQTLRRAQLAKDAYLEAQRQATDLLKFHDELLAEAKAWNETIPPLLKNDAGKKLATKPESVRLFATEYDKRRVSHESIAALRKEISELALVIQQVLASADGPQSAPSDITKRLSDKHAQVQSLLNEYRNARRQILALAAEATSPGSQTLEQALQELTRRDADERARGVALEVAEANRKSNELEAQRVRSAAEAKLASEAEQMQREKELAEAKSEKVQAVLRFFLTPGYLQPSANGVERTPEKKPMSLAGLRAVGALENSTQGLQKLYFVVCHEQETDRPRWGTENNVEFIDRKVFERLKTTQEYLLQYGDALVELKKLSP